MGVEELKYRQQTLPFQETERRYVKPAQSTEEIPKRKDSGREEGEKLAGVSTEAIHDNPVKVELKYLLANLRVLKGSSTSDILSNEDQDYTLIPRIIKLNPRLTQEYIAQEIFGTICNGLGVSAEDAKTKLENLKKSKPQFSPLENEAIFAILTRQNTNKKPLQGRPQQEEHFNRSYFINLNFNNEFHALNWVINAEDKLKFFIGKAKINQISNTDFYRYLVLLRRGLEKINIQKQQGQATHSDGKSAGVGGEKYWEN